MQSSFYNTVYPSTHVMCRPMETLHPVLESPPAATITSDLICGCRLLAGARRSSSTGSTLIWPPT